MKQQTFTRKEVQALIATAFWVNPTTDDCSPEDILRMHEEKVTRPEGPSLKGRNVEVKDGRTFDIETQS